MRLTADASFLVTASLDTTVKVGSGSAHYFGVSV